ncbi:RDD family protein [Solitalea longa]|uniref:RDD family protein n=1 Tax=Solitalea longa TaxID=2079460 RepID=A0A2S5A4H0_9SPHI|nr:RDD family protein [Solitalea longa]POY37478.1 RDD family protein [Solitalea longa]
MSEILEENKKQGSASDLHIAPTSLRFANYLIDLLVCVFVLVAIIGKIIPINDKTTPEELAELLKKSNLNLVIYAVIIGYYFVLETVLGQTIGKLITGTKVVDDFGNKPKVLKVLVRTLCRLIPFEAISFLFTPMGWHDSISKTYVVKKNPNI